VSIQSTEAASSGVRAPRVGVRAGNLEVRLAETAAELDAAQALRFRVFYDEMGAEASARAQHARRDCDDFDAFCDHLLVIDHARDGAVVGTYRLLRRSVALRHGGFYSAREYDLAPLMAHQGEVMELGRSCVAAEARTQPTLQLLWRGIAAYVFQHDVTLMFGCASLPGTDADALAVPLSYLFHHHRAPETLRARALPQRFIAMERLPRDGYDAARARADLPPLIKGYLRLGGFVGDGAVVDRPFNTTDVCVVVQTDRVTEKYYRHYERGVRGDGAH
jgi:putative hemolysin